MTNWVLQGLGEAKVYTMDWSDELETGEEVETSSWSITPDLGAGTGGEVVGYQSSTGLETQALVSGLSPGQTYTLRNTVVTNEDRMLSRDVVIRCSL